MALTTQERIDVSRVLATTLFPSGTLAHATHKDIFNAVAGVDAAFDVTLAAAVIAVGGTTTVINALASQVTVPANGSGWTAAEKTLIATRVLEKRAGLI